MAIEKELTPAVKERKPAEMQKPAIDLGATRPRPIVQMGYTNAQKTAMLATREAGREFDEIFS